MIEEISTFERLCAIRDEWSDLWNRVQATPFQSPDWLLPWWKHLFGGGEMWTIAVREQGRLTGLAPMFIYGNRKVVLIGSGLTDYLGFLAEDQNAARQIWDAIQTAADRWKLCDFQEIPPDSPMQPIPDGLSVHRSESSICPIVSLPATMAEFEGRLSPNFRHNIRNARNRLMKLGAMFEASQDIEDLFRLHARRWKSRGEAGVLASPCVQSFLRVACPEARRLYALRLGQSVKAMVCIFCAHRRAAYYIGGFDDEFSRFSPGSALIHFAIQKAIEDHCVEFDFLRRGERYKYAWGAVDRANTRLLIYDNSETSARDR